MGVCRMALGSKKMKLVVMLAFIGAVESLLLGSALHKPISKPHNFAKRTNGARYSFSHSTLSVLHMQKKTEDPSSDENDAEWDKDETDRFQNMLTKAIRSNKAQMLNVQKKIKSTLTMTRTSPTLSPGADGAAGDQKVEVAKAGEGKDGLSTEASGFGDVYGKWRALIRRSTRRARGPDGEVQPRAAGFGPVAPPPSAPEQQEEQELTAIGKWQRTNGPFYIQFSGGLMMVVGFLNYISVSNQNGSGIEGLSQPLWTCSLLVILLGFALERKTPDEQ